MMYTSCCTVTTCGFDMVYTSCCVHTQLEQLLVDDVFTAFSADGLNESHPIVQTVSNPNEINALFDSISYSKVSVGVSGVLPPNSRCFIAYTYNVQYMSIIGSSVGRASI